MSGISSNSGLTKRSSNPRRPTTVGSWGWIRRTSGESRLRKWSATVDIEVDGGVDLTNIEKAAAAGANVFVAGTSVFHAPDPVAALKEMRQKAERAYGV